MLHEADLFVQAEIMLVEVLGRIRPPDADLVLPEMWRGADGWSVGQAAREHQRADARVPAVLAGEVHAGEVPAGAAPPDGPPPEVADIAAAAERACVAARGVRDGDSPVRSGAEQQTAAEFLLRSTVTRSLLAHYVAARLGSTACPLPEELARPLWELTGPSAAAWRELGYFREPMPLPPHVSWRDRFLLCAGHEPHPFGH